MRGYLHDPKMYCVYHRDHGYDTKVSQHLKSLIEILSRMIVEENFYARSQYHKTWKTLVEETSEELVSVQITVVPSTNIIG